ncbi:MAG TPA: NAD(P)H-dependent oxidoreductase subunit E [Symbiobacteriaceae bacterium]|jgi:NADH:ubiquinone oxidoreductase subunit E
MAACCNCRGIASDDPRFIELDAFITTARDIPGSLISVLHRAQQLFGFLPQEVQDHIARGLAMPPSEVYGVVTFYNLFNTEPVGRFPISVCMGTACYVRGGDRILAKLEQELGIHPGQVCEDGLFSLEVCRCIGACGLAPVITIAGEVHGKLTDQDIPRLLAEVRQQEAAASQPVRQERDAEWQPAAR